MNEPAINSVIPDFPEQENPPTIDNQRRTVLKAIGLAGLAAVTLPVINNIPRPIRSLIATQDENVQTNETDKKAKGNLEVFDFDNYTVEQETFIYGSEGTPDLRTYNGFVYRAGDELYKIGIRNKRTGSVTSIYSAIGNGRNENKSPDIIDSSWFDDSGTFMKYEYMKAMVSLYKIQKRFTDLIDMEECNILINDIGKPINSKLNGTVLGRIHENDNVFQLSNSILALFDHNGKKSIDGLPISAATLIHENIHRYLKFDIPMEEAFTQGLTYLFLEDYFFNGIMNGKYVHNSVYANMLSRRDGQVIGENFLSGKNGASLSYESGFSNNYLAPYMYSLFKNVGFGLKTKEERSKLSIFLKDLRLDEGLTMQDFYEMIKGFSTSDTLPSTFSEYINLTNKVILGDYEGFESCQDTMEAFSEGINYSADKFILNTTELGVLNEQKDNDYGILFFDMIPGEQIYKNLSNLKPGKYILSNPLPMSEGHSTGMQFRDGYGLVHNISGLFEFEIPDNLEENKASFIAVCSLDKNKKGTVKLIKVN
jgi:hypothetical protein